MLAMKKIFQKKTAKGPSKANALPAEGKIKTDADAKIEGSSTSEVKTQSSDHPLKRTQSSYLQPTKSSSQKCLDKKKGERVPMLKKSVSVHNSPSKPQEPRLKLRIVVEKKVKESNIRPLSTDTPCVITLIIRGPTRPRPVSKFALNSRTMHNFDQVLNEITKQAKPVWGSVRKVYRMNGKEVRTIRGLMDENKMFFVSQTTMNKQEFTLHHKELIILKLPVPVDLPRSTITIRDGFIIEELIVSVPDKADSTTNEKPRSGIKKSDSDSSTESTHYIPAKTKSWMNFGVVDYDRAVTDFFDLKQVVKQGNGYINRLCLDKINGQRYEVKVINVDMLPAGNEENLDPDQDFYFLKKLRHPNIITIFDDIKCQRFIYALLEHAENGTLRELMKKEYVLVEEECCGIVRDVASALEYLHSQNIVHREINPENIMCCFTEAGEGIVKLGSFDHAIEVTYPLSAQYGNMSYMAPEMLDEVEYGLKVDIWSMGVILYEMLCGVLPFIATSQGEMSELIRNRRRIDWDPEVWEDIEMIARKFMLRIMDSNAETRLSATEILEEKWLVYNASKRYDFRGMKNRFFRTNAFDFRVFDKMGLSSNALPYGGFLQTADSP